MAGISMTVASIQPGKMEEAYKIIQAEKDPLHTLRLSGHLGSQLSGKILDIS